MARASCATSHDHRLVAYKGRWRMWFSESGSSESGARISSSFPALVDYLDAPLDTSAGEAKDASRMTGPLRLAARAHDGRAGEHREQRPDRSLVVGFLLQLCSVDPQIVWPAGALVAFLSAVVHFRVQQRSFANAGRDDRQPSLDG